MTRALIILIAAGLLGGCASKSPASIAGGECRIFERPAYAVRGAKAYDQDWIDSQVEGGVGGCGWKRPMARPASINGGADLKAVPAPAKRRGIIKRFKDRMTGVKPIDPVPYLAPTPAAQPVSEPPPPPRDRVDELLRPSAPRLVYPR